MEELRATKIWYSEQPRLAKTAKKAIEESDGGKPKKKPSKAYQSTSEDFPTLGGEKAPPLASSEDVAEGEAEAQEGGVVEEVNLDETAVEVPTPAEEGAAEETTEQATAVEDAAPAAVEAEAASIVASEVAAPSEAAQAEAAITAPAAAASTSSEATSATKAPPLADKMTYSDDKALGVSMPGLTSLKWLQDEAPVSGKPLVVLFWAKFAKGDYKHLAQFSQLAMIGKLQLQLTLLL